MFKWIISSSMVMLSSLTLSVLPIYAQTAPPSSGTTVIVTDLVALHRAKNLARMAAEKINGGLNYYRADRSMYGPVSEAPYVDNGDGTWTFTFSGYQPGSTTPMVETAVTVSQDGSEVTVDYNRPIPQS
jgi:hypothetical protein